MSADDGAWSHLAYVPGLDGIRALALVAVLCFHQGFPWARGGFLGVSTFFTLSGYLITSLALREWAARGRFSPARFYERRARRLLPAALVTLLAVVVLCAVTDIGNTDTVRGDLLASLAYVANWRFAATGHGYAALFAAPSPVLHFWSLAIEEQFYVLFPLVFVGLMTLTRGRRHRVWLVGGGFATLATGSFALAWILSERHGNDGTTYYGTHVRAGELLAGVTLACVLRSAAIRRALATPTGRLVTGIGGALALAELAVIWHRATLGSADLFRGGTAINAALTCIVIVAVEGGLGRVLGAPPLRGVGKVSYGAYLYHWPIFLVLAAPRVDLDGGSLFAARVAATLVVATVSYHLVESPFRWRLRVPRARVATGFVTAGVLTAAVIAFALPPPAPRVDFVAGLTGDDGGQPVPAAAGTAAAAAAAPTQVAALAPEPPPGPATIGQVKPRFDFLRRRGEVQPTGGARPAIRILLVGDSMSSSYIVGMRAWNAAHPDRQLWVDTYSVFGCPMVDTGVTPLDRTWPTLPECADWHRNLPVALSAWHDDVVFFTMGLADLRGHEIGGRLVDLGDAGHDHWFTARIGEVADVLTTPGVPVVWSTFPHVRLDGHIDPSKTWKDYVINQPWRVDRFNDLLRTTVAGRPGVTLAETAAEVASWPSGEFDPHLRDGVHFLRPGSERIDAWLIPQLLVAAGPAIPRSLDPGA